MQLVNVTLDNIETEHICCAMTEKKNENCIGSKKAWMKERFKDGLVFTKLDVRGKVFIEYIPIEHVFAPIEGKDLMYINCFWVSGKYKGQGHANQLLEACIEDAKAKGKKGLVALGSKKKMHFLSDPKYLKHKGFEVCDQSQPSFELLWLPFEDALEMPKFKDCMRSGEIQDQGVVIYYSNGCPHTAKYIAIIDTYMTDQQIDHQIIKLESKEEAQSAPAPCTNYAVFIDGKFVTSEVLTEKRLKKLLEGRTDKTSS